VELGDLELAVLRAVRSLGEASSGDVFEEVRKTRDAAYTSVTTTLYRLVDKDLVAVRKQSEKRVFYRIKEGRAYRKAMATMMDSVIDTFGGAAVSYLLENPSALPEEQLQGLKSQVATRRKKEKRDG
jgi:predicted transcriptional regulator